MADDIAPVSPPAPPSFVDQVSRSEVVHLQWPLTYDGRLWDKVVVSRPDTARVAAFVSRVNAVREAGGDTSSIPVPLYDAPDAVINALDPDDDDALEVVARRFLPARFQAAPAG